MSQFENALDGRHVLREVDELSWPAAFEQQVKRSPDAVAVACESDRLTYAELNARANRLARLLRRRGVRAEDVVGVAVGRSVDLVVTLLAVLKAGAAYLPLDLDHPPDRVEFMVRDAGCQLVVSTVEHRGELPDVEGLEPVLLDDDDLGGFDSTDLGEGPAGLDHAAYVIYTSGSTGRPKGVVVSHEGFGSLVATAIDRLGVNADSRVLQFASVGFDVAVWDLTMTLCVGGRAVVVPAERRVAGEALTGYIAEHRITHMILPPSLVAALPRAAELPDGAVLVVGTETVPSELIHRWSLRLRVVVAYGLTEATVNSTLWTAEPGWVGPAPIGRPDPNTCVQVLDTALRPLGVGAVGELYIAGRGLARGYLGRPALTAGRFVADPFGRPGARMYRTGDQGRWRADGTLDFLGRVDGQVKIRGHRVELGEIQAALMRHPDVSQAAVLTRESRPGMRQLVAYVVPHRGNVDPGALRNHVAAILPDYMVPAAVVGLAGPLPLTPNGKLDTSALPPPEFAALAGDAEPTTPAEHTLAALFALTLGVPRVGVGDNFFALGGDSIVAIGLVSRAREAGLIIRPRDVFQHRTVAALARVAREQAGRTTEGDDGTGVVSHPDHRLAARARRGDRRLLPVGAPTGACRARPTRAGLDPPGDHRPSRPAARPVVLRRRVVVAGRSPWVTVRRGPRTPGRGAR